MAFPTTNILDNFNRSDADPLDGSWTTPISIVGIVGQAHLLSNTITGRAANAFWNASQPGPDVEAYITISTLPATGAGPVYVYGRMTTADASSDGYSADFRIAGGSVHTTRLLRLLDGDGTELASRTDITWSNGDSLGLEIIGTTIKLYRKSSGVWTELLSATDSTYQAAGYIGFGMADENAVLDDFGGGNVGSAQRKIYVTKSPLRW